MPRLAELLLLCFLLFLWTTFVDFIDNLVSVPRHLIVGVKYYGFMLDVSVCLSIHPSVIRLSIRISFPYDNLVNISGFSLNLVCTLIFWRSGLRLLMGKFVSLWQLAARHTSIFSFLDNNLSIYQWIFTKLDMCIHIVQIWFEIVKDANFVTFWQSCLHST